MDIFFSVSHKSDSVDECIVYVFSYYVVGFTKIKVKYIFF